MAPPPVPSGARDLTGLPLGHRAIIVLTVMAATLMEVLDTSIVNVALPDMMGNLGATLDEIGWVATGYIISNVIVLPLTGWFSDRFGRRRYLTASIALFTVASFGCGTSRSLGMLIFFRVLQGAGGAAFLATAQATLMELFPRRLQGFAQALFGIGVVMAPTLGPTLGGFLTDRYTWPWIFFINIPIGALATLLCARYVPDSPSAHPAGKVDVVGIALLALGLGALQILLERGEREDWFASRWMVVAALAATGGLALFVWWELRPQNRAPAVDLRIVGRDRNLAAGSLFAFVLGFVLYGGVFVVPQYLQGVSGHTAEQTGLLLLPGGLATACMMPLVGKLARTHARLLMGAGMVVIAIAMFQFQNRLTPSTPDAALFVPLVLRGVGIGLQFVPLSVVALGTLPPHRVAQGAGFYNLFRQLGGSFGIAALTTLLDRRMALHHARLVEHLGPDSPLRALRLHQMAAGLGARGLAAAESSRAALEALGRSVTGQAALLSFVDCFRVMGLVALATLVLLVAFKKPRQPSGMVAH